MVKHPPNGPQNEQRGPDVLYQQNTLIQQVVNFEYDPELRHLVQGNDASIEQIIKESFRLSKPWDTCRRCSLMHSQAFEVTPKIRIRICTIWPDK